MHTCVGIICLTQLLEVSAEIYDATGCTRIGEVTSAAFSPCIKAPIAMAYIGKAFSKPGTDVMVKSTNGHKMHAAQVIKTPFVPTRFHKIPEVLTPVRDPATGEEFETPRIVANNDESKVQQPHVNDVGPMKKEYDSFTIDDLELGSSIDEFESPRSVATIFRDTPRFNDCPSQSPLPTPRRLSATLLQAKSLNALIKRRFSVSKKAQVVPSPQHTSFFA